jgi:hypothetical protein
MFVLCKKTVSLHLTVETQNLSVFRRRGRRKTLKKPLPKSRKKMKRTALFVISLLLVFLARLAVSGSEKVSAQIPVPVVWEVVHNINPAFDWYVQQGPGVKDCGPASVAMLVRYASNNTSQPTPSQVRVKISKTGQVETSGSDLSAALDKYKVGWTKLTSQAEIDQAILNDHPVMILLDAANINPGPDLVKVDKCAAGSKDCFKLNDGLRYQLKNDYTLPLGWPTRLVYGRYYPGAKIPHWILLKGIVNVDDVKHYIAYDPDTFNGNPLEYFYSGIGSGREKGRDRVYKAAEIETAMNAKGWLAYGIQNSPANPVQPTELPLTPHAAGQAEQPAAVTTSVQWAGDITFPQGSVFTPGQAFSKGWLVTNLGPEFIGLEYYLVQTGGPILESSGLSLIDLADSGTTFPVYADLKAPSIAGQYNTTWQIVRYDGQVVPGIIPLSFSVVGQAGQAADGAAFISDVTLPDKSVVSAGQSLTKTWRIQNSGSSTWGAGYKLAFVNGEQMGAPTTVETGTVAPNSSADLSVQLTAPAAAGEHTGYFQLRNGQGTYFGPRVWVKINVQTNNPASGNILSFDISPASPSAAALVHLVGRSRYFSDFRSMRFVVGNEVKEMTNFRQVGDQMEISTDWNTAALARGGYAVVLEVAKKGDPSWAYPERQVQIYTLNGTPAAINRPPDRPILQGPYNWYLKDAGGASSSVQLCVQPASDPDGNPVSYYFEVNGGAITSSLTGTCWTNNFNPGTYSWRAKSSDGSLYSDWSTDTWNFTVAKGGVYIGGMSLYAPESNDTHICVPITYDGIQAPDVYAWINLAADGSQNGNWKMLDHYGPNASPDCTSANVHGWWIRSPEFDTGNHAIKVNAIKRDSGANQTSLFSYNIAYMRPQAPQAISPSSFNNNGTWWNSTTINFQWGAVARVSTYTLRVSTNSNPWADLSPILNVDFGPGVTSYSYTFSQDYPALYWSVKATNSSGSADTGGGIWLGIDRIQPSCQVQSLPAISYENVFKVSWLGIDNAAGIRSYDIQYADSGRNEWVDWLTAVPATKTYELLNGQPGHTYQFRCRPIDNAGNIGVYPTAFDTFIKIDPSARPPEAWWNNAYAAKRNLTILNNMPATLLPTGYPVHLRFDSGTTPSAAEIYNGSLSSPKCNDVRIVSNNTTELNRVVNSCTSSLIDIWFRTQATINGSTSDQSTHQLYFGNPLPGTVQENKGNVFYPSKDANTTGLWYMTEGQGGVVYDQSGNNLNCNLDPTTSWVSQGKFISALHFLSGTDGATVDCGTSSIYNTQNLTIEFYFRSTNNNLWGRFVGNMGNGSQRWALDTQNNQPCLTVWAVNGGNGICATQGFTDGLWHHAAFTVNGTQMAIYLDGQLNKTGTLPGVIKSGNLPLTIGSWENGARTFAEITGVRLSNIARTDFSYGAFVTIVNEPTVIAGALISPPSAGTTDLTVVSINAYPNPTGGILVQVVIKNQGTRDSLNGFFTDLYIDHLPIGSGDLTGSYKFWVNDPIASGATATLTTIIDQSPASNALSTAVPGDEKTTTLYSQVDSTGSVTESTKSNNISQGVQVCVANTDAYEADGSPASATPISMGQAQLHNFTSQGDLDWVSFTAVAGQKYMLKTLNLGPSADTYLFLFAPDGATLLDSNDDSNGALASQISWTAPASGVYYLLSRNWSVSTSGCGTSYTLSVGYPNYPVYLPLITR